MKKLGYRIGTTGDNTLNGHDKIDILLGKEGNDKLYANSGNDILIGGAGNDTLSGASGADSYIFAKGHGKDVVYEGGSNNEKDSLQLTDITLAETKFRKAGNDLVLFGYHEGDSITVKDFFSNSYYEIEQFAFKDQTISIDDFRQNGMRFEGTDAGETISTWAGKSLVYAGKGDDTISTNNQDDLLDGGEGNDKLYASSGNDILIGGTGNDTLSGGSGADSYIFAKGHGKDVVYEGGTNNEKDSLQLTDITLAETKFRKVGNDLVLFGYHEGDSITLNNFFYNAYYEIEQFAFKDQTIEKPNFAQHLNTANNMIQAMSVFAAEAIGNGSPEVLPTVAINPLLGSSAL